MICSIDNRLEEIDKKLSKKYQVIENNENLFSIEKAGQSVFDGAEIDRLSEEELYVRNELNQGTKPFLLQIFISITFHKKK